MRKKLVLYGASNPCVFKILNAINRVQPGWDLVGFIDDTPEKQGKTFYDHVVLGSKEILGTLDQKNTSFFNNVFGSMPGRKQVARILEEYDCRMTTLITPGTDLDLVTVGLDVAIEDNVSVDAGVVISDHCCLKRSSSVGHETVLGEFVFIGPGATVSGRVKLNEGAYLGAGSCILPGLDIGQESIVGAGAVVTKNVPPGVIVAGNPAVVIKEVKG
jgi:sugar O-acyltransferase (sialic acid O-acetyltransferase NeuD family)